MWRDAQTPSAILETFCVRHRLQPPVYGGNTQVTVAGRTYSLFEFEAGKDTCSFWGPPKERLACHVLNGLPVVKEHIETRILRNKLQPAFDQVSASFGEPTSSSHWSLAVPRVVWSRHVSNALLNGRQLEHALDCSVNRE